MLPVMASSKPNPTIICNRCDQLSEKDSRYLRCNASQLAKGELCNMCINDNKPGCDHITQTKATRNKAAAARANLKANNQARAIPPNMSKQVKKAKYDKRKAEKELAHSTIKHQTEHEELQRKCERQQAELEIMGKAKSASAALEVEHDALRKRAAEDKVKYDRLHDAFPGILEIARVAVATKNGGMGSQMSLPSMQPLAYHHNNTAYAPVGGQISYEATHGTNANVLPPNHDVSAQPTQGRGLLFGHAAPNLMLPQTTYDNPLIGQPRYVPGQPQASRNADPLPTYSQLPAPYSEYRQPLGNHNNSIVSPVPGHALPVHDQHKYSQYHGNFNAHPQRTLSNAVFGQTLRQTAYDNATGGLPRAQAVYDQPHTNHSTVPASFHGGVPRYMAPPVSDGYLAPLMPLYQPYEQYPPAGIEPASTSAPSRIPPPSLFLPSHVQWSYNTQQQPQRPQQQVGNQQARISSQRHASFGAAANLHPASPQGSTPSYPPREPNYWR